VSTAHVVKLTLYVYLACGLVWSLSRSLRVLEALQRRGLGVVEDHLPPWVELNAWVLFWVAVGMTISAVKRAAIWPYDMIRTTLGWPCGCPLCRLLHAFTFGPPEPPPPPPAPPPGRANRRRSIIRWKSRRR
jgi:hypothetical protein